MGLMKNLIAQREFRSESWWRWIKRQTENAEKRYKERKQQELNLREQAK